jgi:hypothetical protein
MEGSPPEPPDPSVEAPVEPPELACHRCGAPHDRYQEYCLHCGARLFRLPAGRRTTWSSEGWSRESPLWLWAALAALAVIALISGAIVAFAATGEEDEPRKRAAGPGGTSTLQIITDITTTNTPPTVPPTLTIQPTTTVLPTTGTTTTTTTATTTAPTNTIIAWPAGKDGYTVVIASYPTSGGRSRAETKAREAISKGLTEVGILNSTNYSSLAPGYYVVFSGVHDTEAQARNGLTSVRTAGYPTAYVREISP